MYNMEQDIKEWISQGNYVRSGITITSVAAELNTNRTYLSNYINKMYDCPFRDWVNKLRIERAKELMKADPLKVNETILEEVGYSSRSHFIRVFTDIVGTSPSDWRNENL